MTTILNDPEGKLEPYKGDVEFMVALRQRSADAQKDAEQLKDEADEIFIGLVNLLNVEAIETDEGTYKWITKSGSERLDKKKLKEFLLQKGFDSDTINDAFAHATTVSAESKYAAFYASGKSPKGGKRK